jgi:hypothetical protein
LKGGSVIKDDFKTVDEIIQPGCGSNIVAAWERIKKLESVFCLLQERFGGDYEKFSDFDNISLIVDTLELIGKQ